MAIFTSTTSINDIHNVKIGDILGNRQIIDIIYKDQGKKSDCRLYICKCLKCGNIIEEHTPCRLARSVCSKCKHAIEWNGQLFYNKMDMAKKLNVSKRSIDVWSRLHNRDFSEFTIEWSKSLKRGNNSHKLKYNIGETINNFKIIEIREDRVYPYITQCVHCGKITKKRSDDITQYKCTCLKNKIEIGTIINNRKLIAKEKSKYSWQCLKCGKVALGHGSYPKVVNCNCNQSQVLMEKQILRTIPSSKRKINLPKNIHYRLPDKKNNYYSFRATVQARYKGIRKTFLYENQDLDICIKALPALKEIALYYAKTGIHITYGEYIKKGSPKLL